MTTRDDNLKRLEEAIHQTSLWLRELVIIKEEYEKKVTLIRIK